jgi:hypothetical protein
MSIQEDNTADADETAVEQWLAIRKEAGLQIDPQTAEVYWRYGYTCDPYEVCPDLPDEYQQIGRIYFAHSPESDICVEFGDLPDATREALWAKHKHTLAFPAGLDPEQLLRELNNPAEKSDIELAFMDDDLDSRVESLLNDDAH